MRLILALALLASCAPPPQAPLAGEPSLSAMTYHCSPNGYEFVRFALGDGVEESITGRRCDYEAWREREAVGGPVATRRTPSYEEWRRSQPET